MATGLLTFKPINDYSQQDVQNAQGGYDQSQGNYNQAQQGLQDFTKNMQSGSDLYAQNQQTGNQWAGYDPARLQDALKTVQQTQNVISGLPQTINAQNANYGATAGNLAGQYSGMMANLNPALAAQTNQVAQQQATQQAAGQYAQGATSAGIQVQQQKLAGLQNVVQNSLTQMDQARQALKQMQDLFQSQGQFNSAQQAEYEKANAAYIQAGAAAQLASTQARLIQQQIDQLAAAATPEGQIKAQQQAKTQNYLTAAATPGNPANPDTPIQSAPIDRNPINSFMDVVNGMSNFAHTANGWLANRGINL